MKGLYEGYAADVFPGLAQAIRTDFSNAKAQMEVVAQQITTAAYFLAGSK